MLTPQQIQEALQMKFNDFDEVDIAFHFGIGYVYCKELIKENWKSFILKKRWKVANIQNDEAIRIILAHKIRMEKLNKDEFTIRETILFHNEIKDCDDFLTNKLELR